MIVLSGVKVADLKSIMQFIYTGEVSVTEDDLADLLEVADMLGVRGLKSGQEKQEESAAAASEENSEERGENTESQESGESGESGETVTQQSSNEASESKNEEIVPSISITKVSQTPPSLPPPETSSESSPPSPPPSQQPETFQISVKKDLTRDLTEPLSDDIIQVEGGEGESPAQFSPYFPPAPYSLASPLVSMTNLAAMYQQTASSPTKVSSKERNVVSSSQRSLEWYRHASQQGAVALDLLPEDVNSIMSQSTTPFCPICNKDCANFPNLRSHLQVSFYHQVSSQYLSDIRFPRPRPVTIDIDNMVPLHLYFVKLKHQYWGLFGGGTDSGFDV